MLDVWLISFWLLTLGLAWYPCCTTSYECTKCSGTMPTTVGITLANITAGVNCNCSNVNTSYTLTQSADCVWSISTTVSDVGVCDPLTVLISATAGTVTGSNWGWAVNVRIMYPGATTVIDFEWDSGGTTAFNCSTQRTPSRTYAYASAACTPWSATCTIN